MRLALTGVTGFVGSNLVPVLLENGFELKALVRKTSRIDRLKRYDGLRFTVVDFLDKSSLKGVFDDVDGVIHIAGTVAGLTSNDYIAGNYLVTKNLVDEFLRVKHGGQFVYVSSQAAAGPSKVGRPRKESDREAPVSIYGKSKLYAEKYIRAHEKEINYTILRPPAIYGPGDKAFLFYLNTVKQHYFPHIGNLQELSIVHVDDVIQALRLFIGNPEVSRKIFFLSDGEIYHILELVNELKKAMNVEDVRILHIPAWIAMIYAFFNEKIAQMKRKPSMVNRDKIKELSQEAWTVDISLIKSVGFKPEWNFQNGIEQTVRWYREKGWI